MDTIALAIIGCMLICGEGRDAMAGIIALGKVKEGPDDNTSGEQESK